MLMRKGPGSGGSPNTLPNKGDGGGGAPHKGVETGKSLCLGDGSTAPHFGPDVGS